MTRAATPSESLEFRSFGTPGAERTVVLLRLGGVTIDDPLPSATVRHDIRVLAIGLTVDDLDDPAAYRGQSPAETSTISVISLIDAHAPDAVVGLVGVGAAGNVAVRVAAAHGGRVDRLALVGVPAPETPAERDLEADVLRALGAKTLVVGGENDPDAGPDAASFYGDLLPDADVELTPPRRPGDDRLALADVWSRVLDHCAPQTLRRG